MKPTFDIVVAHDANFGIGIDNKLAWHLPEDMSFFKRLTMGDESEKKYNQMIIKRQKKAYIDKPETTHNNRYI